MSYNKQWGEGHWATLYMFISAVFLLLLSTIASDCNITEKCLAKDNKPDVCNNELNTFW